MADSALRSALSRVPGADKALPFLDIDGPVNVVRIAWDRLRGLPYGNVVFSRMIGRAAPYTGSIRAVVTDLTEGHSQVVLKDRPELRNHLDCVHAITLANLAEMTGNVALAYGLPDDARFIVAGMDLTSIDSSQVQWRPRDGSEGLGGLRLSMNTACFKALGHPRLKPGAANQAPAT
jgi:hypothetical protein